MRELDARVAEAMGFTVIGVAPCTFHDGCPLVHRPINPEWDAENAHPVTLSDHDHATDCEGASDLDREEMQLGHHTAHLEPVEFYSTSGDGLLAMLRWHAEAGRTVFLTVMPFGSMAQIEHGEPVGGATPGEALARATLAWKESK